MYSLYEFYLTFNQVRERMRLTQQAISLLLFVFSIFFVLEVGRKFNATINGVTMK